MVRCRGARFGVLAGISAVMPLVTGCGGDVEGTDVGRGTDDIVGGVESAVGAWKPTVKIRLDLGGGSTSHCDGTLIHPQWILTAAHCISDTTDPAKYTDGTKYKVIIGRHDEVNDTGGEVIFGTGAPIPHPSYNPSTSDADIGLLKLASPSVQMTAELVTPARLAMLPDGSPTTSVGWGSTTTGGPLSNVLREVDAPIVCVGTECNSGLTNYVFVTQNQIGIGAVGKGWCGGDSGGPAWVRTDGLFRELGISSYRSTAGCAVAGFPPIGTLVPNYYDWVYGKLPATEGFGWFLASNGTASLSSLAFNADWTSLWHAIVPGSFGGDAHTDLLFYQQRIGTAALYTSTGTGTISLLSTQTGWGSNWETLVPGQFGGDSNTDVMLYDPVAGQIQFRTTDSAGHTPILKTLTGIRHTWQIIVPGDFNGDAFTDLLLYDPIAGEAEFRTTDGAGNMALQRLKTGFKKTWNAIVPGQFGGNARTDLLFYDQQAGQASFYTTNGTGDIILLKNATGWRTTWQHIVPANLNGDGFTDLFFYDTYGGAAALYTTNGAGNISLIGNVGAIPTTFIVPGDFGGNSFTDFLFYDRWRG